MIKQLKLEYGTDVVFTYGPLGYLGCTRLPIAVNRWQLFGYDLWLIIQGTVLIWIVLRKNFTVLNVAAVLLVSTILYNGAGGDPPFLYLYFVLFLLCYHLQTRRDVWFFNALGIAVFAFYVKGNTGLVCLGCLLLYVTYYFIHYRPKARWYAGMLLAVFLAVSICAYVFNVDLYRYTLANIQLIDSYNDVMRFYNANGERALFAALLIVLLYILTLLHLFWGFRKIPGEKTANYGVIIFFSAVSLFVLFKEGFVRSDSGHNCLFFKYAFLPLSLLAVFIPHHALQRDISVVALLVLVSQLLFVKPAIYFNHPKQLAHYVEDVLNPTYSAPDSIRRFPKEWTNRLRRGTVDIIPYDIASVYLNGLTRAYRPRPVFQSYQVTNHFLDSLNTSFYESSRAPEYIIYAHQATDNRYPFSEEIGTRLTMLRYYDLVDKAAEESMMLKRRTSPKKLDTVSVSEVESRLQDDIYVPPTSTLQLVQIEMNYSLLGRLIRLFFQPPTLTLELETADRKWHSYQASTTLLANGFLANRWVPDTKAFQDFLLSKGNNNQLIRRFRITTPRWNWALDPSIRIRRTQLSW
ncbi:hypothetical protein [Spirosoma sp.]|uniref:hypothetical protein n=1 Tax=Spirosoma sp. TaxID=1899569 RepID=UPI003B3AABC4